MLNLLQQLKTAFRKIGGFFVDEIMGFKIFYTDFTDFHRLNF